MHLTTGIDTNGGSGQGYAAALFDNVFVNDDSLPYDDFSSTPLDQGRWRELEFGREITVDQKLRWQ